MGNNSTTQIRKTIQKIAVMATLDLSDLGLGKWKPVFHDQSPLLSRNENNKRHRYATWLADLNKQKGIYLWLYPLPDNNGYRFIHVGMSTASLAARTRAHCRNQFNLDRVHRLSFAPEHGQFGTLGDDLRKHLKDRLIEESELQAAARDFLGGIRILFLIPEHTGHEAGDRIKTLEGLIAWSASFLLGEKESNNTLSKTRHPVEQMPAQAETLAERLNAIVPSLPSHPLPVIKN